jgi:hypothetical protein
MKAEPFDSTPDFQHFKKIMQRVLAVPKTGLGELVWEAKEKSLPEGGPNALGQKSEAPPW